MHLPSAAGVGTRSTAAVSRAPTTMDHRVTSTIAFVAAAVTIVSQMSSGKFAHTVIL
jgi:hypothetical protein